MFKELKESKQKLYNGTIDETDISNVNQQKQKNNDKKEINYQNQTEKYSSNSTSPTEQYENRYSHDMGNIYNREISNQESYNQQTLLVKIQNNNTSLVDSEELYNKQSFKQKLIIKIRPLIGMIISIIGNILMVVCMILFRQIQIRDPNFTSIELMVVRGYSQMFLQYIQFKLLGASIQDLSKFEVKLIFFRSFLSFCNMNIYWYAIQYLPLGITSTIYFMSPFVTLILGFLILKEKMKYFEILNMIISFTGVLLIVYSQKIQREGSHNKILDLPENDEFIRDSSTSQISADSVVSDVQYWFSIVLMIISACINGSLYIVLRKLKHVHFSIVNGHLSVVLSVTSSIMWYFFRYMPSLNTEDYNNVEERNSNDSQTGLNYVMDVQQIYLIVLLALATNFGNQCPIIAVKYDKASRVSSLNFLQIFFAYMGDIVMFGYSIRLLELSGALIIIVCSTIAMILKYMNCVD
eukprot:403341181